jgi:hypothetical protein
MCRERRTEDVGRRRGDLVVCWPAGRRRPVGRRTQLDEHACGGALPADARWFRTGRVQRELEFCVRVNLGIAREDAGTHGRRGQIDGAQARRQGCGRRRGCASYSSSSSGGAARPGCTAARARRRRFGTAPSGSGSGRRTRAGPRASRRRGSRARPRTRSRAAASPRPRAAAAARATPRSAARLSARAASACARVSAGSGRATRRGTDSTGESIAEM